MALPEIMAPQKFSALDDPNLREADLRVAKRYAEMLDGIFHERPMREELLGLLRRQG